jgi:prevent-host-death family protein
MYNLVVGSSVTVSEARASLPAIVERVMAGEEVTLTRHGQPVAVVVRPDTLRLRRAEHALAAAASVEDALEVGRTSRLSTRPTLSEERADALVAAVGKGRAGR